MTSTSGMDPVDWDVYRRWALTDGRLSPRTTDKSVRYLRWLTGIGIPLNADRDALLQALASAREAGRPPYTLNLWVVQINRWIRFRGLEWRLPHYRHQHVADVPAPTREQVSKLWRLAWGDPGTTSRNRALLAVFVDKGLRRQEVVDLNVGDFVQTRKGPTLIVRHGKGEKERAVPIAPPTAELLRVYISRYRAPSDPLALFTTIRGRLSHAYVAKVIKLAGARAGIPWVSCHKLRHFATDDMLDRGVPIQAVAHVLGHDNVETTMLYRSRRLNRIHAENEVRSADRGRFRAGWPARAPRIPAPDFRAEDAASEALSPIMIPDENTGPDTSGRRAWRSGHGGI